MKTSRKKRQKEKTKGTIIIDMIKDIEEM